MAKLTLHVDEELIAAAKEEAASRHTSVSKLVSGFFRVLSTPKGDEPEKPLPPITVSLVGCLHGAEDDIEVYVDHLQQKHS